MRHYPHLDAAIRSALTDEPTTARDLADKMGNEWTVSTVREAARQLAARGEAIRSSVASQVNVPGSDGRVFAYSKARTE